MLIRHLGLRYHVGQGVGIELGEKGVEEFNYLGSRERKSIQVILEETVSAYSS